MDVGAAALLDNAVARLRSASTLAEVQDIARGTARQVVAADGATVVLLDGDQCYYLDEDSMSPLWKGQRFPVDKCISGWAMVNRQTLVVPDIRVDPRIPQRAYRPTFVRSLIMTPVRRESPLGAIGVYWARRHRATTEEVTALETLSEAVGKSFDQLLEVTHAEAVGSSVSAHPAEGDDE
jgi:GAF domain-containing protein